MKTNSKNLSRMVATTLAVIPWPVIAQETSAPTVPPEVQRGEAWTMRQAGERLETRTMPDAAANSWRIGLMVDPIEPALRSHLEIPENTGVVVTQCLDQSPAAKAGIKKNDIILSENGSPVGSIEPLRESVEVSAKPARNCDSSS